MKTFGIYKGTVLPTAPLEEAFNLNVYYATIPIPVTGADDIKVLTNRLPNEILSLVLNGLRDMFANVPDYRKISSQRHAGARFVISNRFIPIAIYEELEEHLGYSIDSILAANTNTFSIPRRYRFDRSEVLDVIKGFHNDDVAFVHAALPLIVAGAW